MKRKSDLGLAHVFLAALVLGFAGCATPEGEPDSPLDATYKVERERAAPLELAVDSPLSVLENHRVLFVGGFLSELIPGYFTDNARVVHDELHDETTLLFPASRQALSDDADQVRDAVLADERPTVLVGHSKGGAAVVLAALRYPELVLGGRVACVIAIQGALGGSPIADGLAFAGPEAWGPRAFRGLESLRTTEVKALFAAALAELARRLSPEDLARLSSRIFYARAYENRRLRVAGELALTHAYLSGKGSGHDDGMLLEEDEKLDAIGVDLGCVLSDHGSLTVSSFLATSSRPEREAFTRALFREVGCRLVRAEAIPR